MGARFSAPVQTGPGAHPASCTMGTGSLPGVTSGRGVTPTPQPLLVPWSWKSRAIPLFLLWAVWPVQSLSACTRVHFTLPFYSWNTSPKQHCFSHLCQWAFVIDQMKKVLGWQYSAVSDQWCDHPKTCQQFQSLKIKKDHSGSEVIKLRENKIVKLDWNSVTHDIWQLQLFWALNKKKKRLPLHDRTSELLLCTIRDVI